MARSVGRSASSGRFVKASTVKRNPGGTTTENVGRGTPSKTSVNRSAASGRFVTEATARRHPDKTITQKV